MMSNYARFHLQHLYFSPRRLSQSQDLHSDLKGERGNEKEEIRTAGYY
jgi:hypothetical protein